MHFQSFFIWDDFFRKSSVNYKASRIRFGIVDPGEPSDQNARGIFMVEEQQTHLLRKLIWVKWRGVKDPRPVQREGLY